MKTPANKLKSDMLKAGYPYCYGKEHCNSCKKDYEKRFQEVANHERLVVGSKKVDKKYGKQK